MYKYFLKTFDLDPATCFFLDNQIENIEEAQKVGIQGSLVETTWWGKPDYKKAYKDLDAWLKERSPQRCIPIFPDNAL